MVKHYLQAFLAMLIICCASPGYAQVVQKLTSSGTWTAPPGVTSVTVEAWGAGGGGGGTALNPSQGGGGADGSYSKKVITVVPGTTYNINVGAGGLAGSTTGITGWEQVAGVYQTLPGQTSVRIRVISSAGNNIPGRGNFIDNVRANYVGCNAVARAAEEEGAPAAMRATVSLSVQPNPVIAQAALVLTGFDDGIVSIDIVSANGTLSRSMKMPYNTGTKLMLDLADYRDGMYFIKVQQNGKIVSSKFTKQQ